ncbi:MAG: hypothetical protein NUK62_02590 [Tenericutes bacterium]|nr:hypothetical protein [Mycoplasmatota bacterium]
MWGFLDIEIENWIYFDIAFIVILLGLLTSFVYIIRKKRLQTKVIPLADEFLDALYIALGESNNIVKVSHEHQRLKVLIIDVKKVNTKRLKDLNIPAFLKGKELTLLIKNHTKEVISYFNDKMREDK